MKQELSPQRILEEELEIPGSPGAPKYSPILGLKGRESSQHPALAGRCREKMQERHVA